MNDSWIILLAMALGLGLRHGFDLDHLATIDSITRTVQRQQNHVLAKLVGCLFSLGHGLVVIVVSLIIGSGLMRSHSPLWLEGVGNWISIFFLSVFGLLTLYNVLQNPSASKLPVSLSSFLSRKMVAKKFNPALIIFVGALFAFSFDTFSQVALFSLSASVLAGWAFAGVLGIAFMLGMMASDGLNGLFVSLLLQRADKTSLIISRVIGLAIASFSLILAAFSISKILS